MTQSRRWILAALVTGVAAFAIGILTTGMLNSSQQNESEPEPASSPQSSVPPLLPEPRPTDSDAPEASSTSSERESYSVPQDSELTSGLVVRTASGADLGAQLGDIESALASQGAELLNVMALGENYWFVEFSEATSVTNAEQAQARLELARVIESGTVNRPIHFAEDVNSEAAIQAETVVRSGVTWGLDRIDQRSGQLDGRYQSPAAEGANVKVYVVDSGVRASHQEFGGRVAAGYSAFGDGCGTSDSVGHGTHVAGTIAGATYGVARRATIVPVRVFNCINGGGDTASLFSGITWILEDHKPGEPAVVNFSLGSSIDQDTDDAVQLLVDEGISVVVAAGNIDANYPLDTSSCDQSPARLRDAITVGASKDTDVRANFSKYGECSDIYAPGVAVTSAFASSNSAIETLSGTSMAAPHVAGVAALKLGERPTLTPAQVWTAISSHATPVDLYPSDSQDAKLLLFVGEPTLEASQDSVIGELGKPIPLITFSARFFDAPARYSISPALPEGLNLDSATGVLSGQPTQVQSATRYTVSASSGSQSATFSVSISVAGGSREFVTAAYQDVLGRGPEPAGLSYWLGRLASGMPRGDMANAFNSSDEYYLLKIREAYNRALNRDPEPSGQSYWLAKLQRRELSPENIYATFLYSDEMYNVQGGGTNPGYVNALYQELLGRPAEADGMNYWLDRLGRERRSIVSDGIWYSNEKYNVRVEEAFQTFLGRSADAGAVSYWSGYAKAYGPTAMRAAIMASNEYWSRADQRFNS